MDPRLFKWHLTLPRSQGAPKAAYRLFQTAWAGIDLVYPPHCAGCGAPGNRWCPTCQRCTPFITPPICKRCGRSLASSATCHSCSQNSPGYTALRSYAYYEGPIKKAVHRLKYKGDLALGDILSQPLIHLLETENWPVDLVTPVPAGAVHRSQRGYNQAALLAWPLALFFGLPYKPKALEKIRQIRSQVGLTIEERHQNVAGAYRANPAVVTGKVVLVVDDVTTSGATLQECSRTLKEAGARQVFGLVLARASFVV